MIREMELRRTADEGLGNGPAISPLERAVERTAAELVAAGSRDTQLLQKPVISAQLVDTERGVGVIVLSEHIDYDGGWCGNQFRSSVWLIRSEGEPRHLLSDHAYYRPELKGASALVGRDPRIDLLEIRDEGVVVRGTGREGDPFGGEKKFIIGFDGQMRELRSFPDEARNLIERIGSKLGYDHLSAFQEIPGADIAAVTFTSENGRDYGFDTVYLVWRDGAGEVQSRRLLRASEYTSIRRCALVDGEVEVVIGAGREEVFKIPARDIGR